MQVVKNSVENNSLTKILELRLQGFSQEKIAEITGYAQQTISKKLKRIFTLVNIEENNAFIDNKVDILTGMERELLNEMLHPDKLKKASLNNVAYAYGQIHNANRLEKGESTANTNIHALIDERNSIQAEQDKLKNAP